MKFILNTAVNPHFCALFSEDGERIDYVEWRERCLDGEELWKFLDEKKTEDLTFIGGVSGPGGFSSLRVGAGVLNSLAFALQIPVHAVRADKWQAALLAEQFGEKLVKVVLNSFGDAVWLREGEELTRYQVEEAGVKLVENRVCVSWLDEIKKGAFEKAEELDMQNAPEVLLALLETVNPNRQFAAEYEVPPV